MQIYVVQPQDTVDSIAAEFGLDVYALVFYNQLIYPYELAVGQALLLPDGQAETDGAGETGESGEAEISSQPEKSVCVSGYAYPFISPWVLSQTLPYLAELPIFSYGFSEEGELYAPNPSADWMIEAARGASVAPILTLTPLGIDGRFNNNLIHSVVNSDVYTERLIQNVVNEMQEKGYQGVNIDFEYILPEDRDLFTVRAAGYHISIALAPKTSADQKGLLYEGKDYGALGAVTDHVLLMTYEWGYTYGPPMAVAPINQVRRVVEYARTEIPAEKIDLGIPNYGYDWPLPYERGVTKATTIGNVQAVRIAIANGATITFDPVAMSPYFQYYDEETGQAHEVWFEDVRSLQAKFDLIRDYGLRGCGYWQIMQWYRANWLLLAENFTLSPFLYCSAATPLL